MDIKNLTFSYDKKKPFIELNQLTIKDSKITTIIGPNGSGKSTLLGLIAGHLKAHSGEVLLDDVNIHQISAKERAKKIAVVHQQNEAPEHYTVRQLVKIGRYPYRNKFGQNEEVDEQIIDEAIEAASLTAEEERFVYQLSGGQRQRTWLALSFAQQSDYLLLDEPTTYLDLHHQLDLLARVEEKNKTQNQTIVMVLHDLNQALQYSDEIIVMDGGRIIAQGEPFEVMTPEFIRKVFKLNVLFFEDPNGVKHLINIK